MMAGLHRPADRPMMRIVGVLVTFKVMTASRELAQKLYALRSSTPSEALLPQRAVISG